jgi:hypothetical protein
LAEWCAPEFGKQMQRLYFLILKGKAMADIVPQETIESRIYILRGKKVMIDHDLAALYGVTTGNFNKAVQRNISRFPEDFMFQLTRDELKNLIFQFGTSRWGGIRKLPYAFSDYGVAMLSGILNSKRAILVNIQIMRAFVRLRNIVADNSEVRKAIVNIEKRLNIHDRQIQIAFDALKSLLGPKPAPQIAPIKHYSPDDEKKMGFGQRKK